MKFQDLLQWYKNCKDAKEIIYEQNSRIFIFCLLPVFTVLAHTSINDFFFFFLIFFSP